MTAPALTEAAPALLAVAKDLVVLLDEDVTDGQLSRLPPEVVAKLDVLREAAVQALAAGEVPRG